LTPDPLLTLIHRVRRRSFVAHASWLFVTSACFVAIAFAAMALTLRFVPMTIGSPWAAIAMIGAIAVIVFVGVLRRWPSEARTAQRIDEALELRELIATGLASTGDDEASRMVRWAAIEKARGIRATDVPLSRPSNNTFVAAMLMLVGAVTLNALLQRTPDAEPAAQQTAPHRTAAGLMDHGPVSTIARPAANQPTRQAEPESSRAPKPSESRDPSTAAVKSGDAPDGQSRDNSGHDRSSTDATSNADLNFHASSNSQPDAKQGDAVAGAASGASSNANPSTDPTIDLRDGASSPRIAEPDQGRSVSQSAHDANESSSRAIAHIPDRHRDIVRAYFDASTTKPADAKR
jgi:hypothetical protein